MKFQEFQRQRVLAILVVLRKTTSRPSRVDWLEPQIAIQRAETPAPRDTRQTSNLLLQRKIVVEGDDRQRVLASAPKFEPQQATQGTNSSLSGHPIRCFRDRCRVQTQQGDEDLKHALITAARNLEVKVSEELLQ